jgi:hypothetical protein
MTSAQVSSAFNFHPSLAPTMQAQAGFHARVQDLLDAITYPGLSFEVERKDGHVSLRVSNPDGICNETSEPLPWNGRWWRLSRHMTDSEVVATAFKAVLTALEHEARESFRFLGQPVYDSHLSVYELAKVRADKASLDIR